VVYDCPYALNLKSAHETLMIGAIGLSILTLLVTGFSFLILNYVYVPSNGIKSMSVSLISSEVKLFQGACLLWFFLKPNNKSLQLKLANLFLLIDLMLGTYLCIKIYVLTNFRNASFLRRLLLLWVTFYHCCVPVIPSLFVRNSRCSRRFAFGLVLLTLR